MSSVIPFARLRVTTDNRTHRPGECAHHNIKLDSRGGIVTCRDCGASLSPFWALTMLAEQYELALDHARRLEDRLARADSRILELSAELDGQTRTKGRLEPAST
ncbi:hypothetical protein [Paraburkholderia dioscoreae]|uniref:Uncharacterized protein n=1 Tax=Paraburkholderia dioscoreae TaxID=2604047 RepID=A0A5Q4ZHG4_9BURK|nr:hypothetical protein [Paraburkholderia dioscoreae]VVD31291.1 conserved protein of unknown function [Paraburkholderia dioscoreae]